MHNLLLIFGQSVLVSFVLSQRLVPFNSQQQIGQYNSLCLTSSQCDKTKGLYCVPPPNSPGGQPRCRCPTNDTAYDETRNHCIIRINGNCAINTTNCPQNSHCSHQDPRNPSLYFYESKCFCDANYLPNSKGSCSPAAKYHEPCNEVNQCDSLAGLRCNQDTGCECAFENDQYYDGDKKRCISFIKKKCTTYYGCVENARCDGLAPAKSRNIALRKPASSDSAMIQKSSQPQQRQFSVDGRLIGKCVCEFGFSPSNNGRCMASFRSACSLYNPCNPLDSLHCQDGTCKCKNPLHMYWDFKLHKCRVLVDGKCTGPTGNTQECVDNSECVNGFCKCKATYSKTPNRKCMKSYQEPCENGTCNLYAGLTCMQNSQQQTCLCMDQTLVYNEKLQACVSSIDMPCGKIGLAGDYAKESFYVVGCNPPSFCKQEVDGDLTTSFCRV